MLAEKILAGFTLLVCVAMLVRLLLSSERRTQLDRGCVQAWQRAQRCSSDLYHWRARRRTARQAAEEAIERARGKRNPVSGRWSGNVYLPDAFDPSSKEGQNRKSPPPRRDMH